MLFYTGCREHRISFSYVESRDNLQYDYLSLKIEREGICYSGATTEPRVSGAMVRPIPAVETLRVEILGLHECKETEVFALSYNPLGWVVSTRCSRVAYRTYTILDPSRNCCRGLIPGRIWTSRVVGMPIRC